jgi:hypothetical protein
MQFRFGLDPTSKKYNCPQCKKKSFVVYVDNETGIPVDEFQFGRCDKENSCSYHVHPNTDPAVAGTKEEFVPRPAPVTIQIFPEERIYGPVVNRTKTTVSPLHAFCSKKLLIPNEHLVKWGVLSDTNTSGESLTVYVFRNAQQQICNLKWFKYKEDGHRDKDFNAFSLKQPKSPPTPRLKEKQSAKNKGAESPETIHKYMLCLFGEHLLDPEKKKIVCVVESEKTAAIASFFYQQYDWVACGSNNGLSDGSEGTPNKVEVLKGREVYWLCDADSAGRMKLDDKGVVRPSSVRHLIQHIEKFHIVDLFPDRSDGYDIGDGIADGIRPEIKTTWSKGKDQAPEKKVEDGDYYDYDLPVGVDFQKVKWDIRKYMHFDHDGRIYICRKRKSDGEKGASFFSNDITNFTIKSLGLIASKADPRRLIEIKNIHGLTKVLQVPTSAFTSQNEFTNFIESEGNFQYDGIGTDLKKIRAKMYDTMEMFEEVESLGWQRDGFFLFANGAYAEEKFHPINKYGFVKFGDKRIYIEALSALSREAEDEWEDEKKFTYKEKKEVDLKKWAKLFCDVHKDNGRIAFAWFLAGLYRDFIYQQFKFFPLTFAFGPPGTGKSQLGWSIRSLTFSGIVKPFNLNTGTAVAFHREFAHFKNTPAWCDEYDNSIPYERIQALKASYDGVGHKKSVKDSDKRTKATQVNRPVFLSGQQLPIADNALFKRVILLQFTQTEFSADEKKIYSELQALEDGGLTHLTAGFMHHRKLIEQEFMKEFDPVVTEMMKRAAEMQFDPEDRIVRNSAIALTVIKVLQTKIEDQLPYTYDELMKVIMANMKSQMSLISNANETNTFWDMVEFLVREKKILEGEDFVFDNKKILKVTVGREDVVRELPKPTEIIYMRFSKIIPLYREAFKRQNSSTASPMDKGSLMHYLSHSKPFLGLVSRVEFKDSRTSAYAFDYDLLKAMGVNLGGSESNRGTPPPMAPSNGGPPAGGITGTPQSGFEFSKVPVVAGSDDLVF